LKKHGLGIALVGARPLPTINDERDNSKECDGDTDFERSDQDARRDSTVSIRDWEDDDAFEKQTRCKAKAGT